MGKAGRWLKNLFTGGKHSSAQPSSSSEEKKTTKEKKRWSFVKSSKQYSTATTPDPKEERRGSYREPSSGFESDPNKHAIAVAAATAAVAEAAVAAAQAAAAVVRLTASRGRCASETAGTDWRKREEWAALRIQSAFRGYLARRALRALKALVKLQALVRGHIVRKQAAATLRSMQALVRVQARVRTHRSLSSTDIQQPFSHFQHSHTGDPLTPEKRDARHRGNRSRQDLSNNKQMNSTKSTKAESDQTNSGRSWIDRWVDNRSNYTIPATSGDDECAKILEVDPGKPSTVSSRRRKKSHRSSQSARAASDRNSQSYTTVVVNSPSRDSTTAQLSTASHSSVDMPVNPLGLPHDDESEYIYATADNSPQYYSASSLHLGSAGLKRGPNSASMKSDDVQSFVDGYSGYCPSYMANTESSRAKARRSQSAPKQRPEFEKLSGSTKRLSTNSGYPDVVVRSSSSSTTLGSQRSLVDARFASSKAYPGSGRLDRLGMPVNVRGSSNSTDVGYRY